MITTGFLLALVGFVGALNSIAIVPQGVINGILSPVPGVTLPVAKFLGIPFARPPQRFSPPVIPGSFAGNSYNATQLQPACIQQFNYPDAARAFTLTLFNNPPPVSESEDCLYLNVYAPSAATPASLLPVMVWIYGGALQFGSASSQYYDGSNIAGKQNLIVVTFNYRTNVFGFPNSPELPNIGQNLGLLDQRLALAWIRANILAFGGDPLKVTIFGESAGALSVDALVTSYSIFPPFRAAIMQSGQDSVRTLTATPGLGTVSGTSSWNALAAGLGCSKTGSVLACLRAADALTIKSYIEHAGLSFQPIVDNLTRVSNPQLRRANRQIANVPVLIGSNAQEGSAFVYGQSNITAALQTLFSGNATLQAEVFATYPVGQNGLNTPAAVVEQIYTDIIFQCPGAIVANLSSAAGYPTFRYYYNATFANIQPVPGLGAYHSSEIPLVFGNFPANSTAAEISLSALIQKSWADFAKNPQAGPGWNKLNINEGFNQVALFNVNGVGSVNGGALDKRCAVFKFDLGGF
ncbi:putative para-nitrobenzyl esterase protein [Botrytis fragariae]|uniref:Carboxylic ester hydrolase n=1 Tax=Botrytis fragariae TaxID=1964551 RepID=A0A8H6AZZ9_9HELO|nr:putative para-nitrobenzyl esterase protein [Botrytis fragariae]KAF5876620.1 putative para-nitrobenzyl esterase protein [Botrytis fragariae]